LDTALQFDCKRAASFPGPPSLPLAPPPKKKEEKKKAGK